MNLIYYDLVLETSIRKVRPSCAEQNEIECNIQQTQMRKTQIRFPHFCPKTAEPSNDASQYSRIIVDCLYGIREQISQNDLMRRAIVTHLWTANQLFSQWRVRLILIEFSFAMFCWLKWLRRNFGTIWHNATINYTFDVTLLGTICVQCKQNKITCNYAPSTQDTQPLRDA